MDTAAMLRDMFNETVAAPLYGGAAVRPERAGPIQDLEKRICSYPAGDCPKRLHACIRRRLACECGDAIKREETE